MKPTTEQQAIILAAKQGSNLAITAFAGAGKSSTLSMIAAEIPKNTLYIAFNKSIATEASEKFPVWVQCRTLHSIAYEHIIKAGRLFRKVANFTDTKKLLSLLEPELELHDDVRALELVYKVLELVKEYCQSAVTDPAGFISEYLLGGDEEANTAELIVMFEKVWEAMTNPKSDITMTHDVYLKLFQLSNPVLDFDVIMLDEAQDSNPVTLSIFYGQKHAQLIMVGDPHQSIYEWRGAVNAFRTVPAEWKTLKLTESFRFNPYVAELATKLLATAGETSPVVGLGSLRGDKSKAILCRTNLDILTHLLQARKSKEKVFVMADLADIWSKLYHLSSLGAGAKPKYPNKQLKMFSNMDEVFREATHNHELSKLLNFKATLSAGDGLHANIVAIKGIIAETEAEAAYTVATLHKSKGLEFDEVIMDSEILGSEEGEARSDHELLAEGQLLNLLYVGLTRSRGTLSMSENLRDLIHRAADCSEDYRALVGGV